MMTPLAAAAPAAADPAFLTTPAPNLFFTGKGGVGKTTCACAAALRLAKDGRRVLLVSTDPASNLDEVLGIPLGLDPRDIPGVPKLRAVNLDPETAAANYRETIVGPARGVLPDSLVASMEEQLSGACTLEIAAFDLFAGLIAGEERPCDVDVVVFDTAPTGHTLRLLSLPAAWSDFLESNKSGNTCLGPLQGLADKKDLYARAVATLTDPEQAEVILVTRPRLASFREAERTRVELASLGVRRLHLVVNGLLANASDPVSCDWLEDNGQSLRSMDPNLLALPSTQVALQTAGRFDCGSLPGFFRPADQSAGDAPDLDPIEAPGWDELVASLSRQNHGMVMTMGKGGVGKTIVAARLAQALAADGLPVVLATTDPAAHLGHATGDDPLEVISIDAAAETEAYRREVLATAGAGLDPEGLALLDEDLRSPCTEEIAVFRAFARIVAEGASRIVVCDTAPTGHTLLLLDATQAYHRELGRQTTAGVPDEVLQLLPRLRDPGFNRVLIAALPEATPVHEAEALEDDLARAGITPAAWVLNQSVGLTGTSDPTLRAKARAEFPWIQHVLARPTPAYVLPWDKGWLY
jgi:arsenite-transporting ATPase